MASSNPKFQIKIPILGCESTGKSTVLNTICAGKVSQAGWQRTTASINAIRLSLGKLTKMMGKDVAMSMDVDQDDKKRPAMMEEGPEKKRLRSLEATYGEIEDVNLRFKDTFGGENFFDVIVNELPITMRGDSQLVLVETPGLNVSKANSEESRAYFRDKWETFDAVIVVMDSQEKVDREDQIENLKFVHGLMEKKEIPCFVLCNKVDDPDNLSPEEDHKLNNVRRRVEMIWKVGCREKALQNLMKSINSNECFKYQDVFPVVVPVSAKTAYLCRAGSAMTKEDFARKMDNADYHSVGLQNFGREWRNMQPEDKASRIHEILQDPVSGSALLQMSGFDKFLTTLEKLLGGEQTQAALIKRNFVAELEKGNFGNHDLYPTLCSLNDKRHIVGEPASTLTKKVWDSYEKWLSPAITTLDNDCNPEKLAFTAQKLIEYQKFCKERGWKDEISKIKTEFGHLVRGVLVSLLNKHANNWSYHTWERASGGNGDRWKHLSPIDWQNIIESILLLRCEAIFCRRFGQDIVMLEKHLFRFRMYSFGCSEGCETFPCPDHDTLHDSVKVELEPDMPFKIKPLDKQIHDGLVTIDIPDDYSTSHKHFAHVGWLFCKSMS